MNLPLFANTPGAVFTNPATQLAAFNPFLSLAASNPFAAEAALSPTLNIFNPAVNPRAAFLAFNPGAAPTLALTGGLGKYGKPLVGAGKFAKPFVGAGKFAKPFIW